jgi:Bacterial Ig domain
VHFAYITKGRIMKISTLVFFFFLLYAPLTTQASNGLQQSKLGVPEGWKAIVAPDAKILQKRYLAVVNMQGKQTQTTISLSYPEGAHILSEETIITGDTGLTPTSLKQYQTLGATLEMYCEVLGKQSIIARKITDNRYSIEPVNSAAKVRLHYFGPAAVRIIGKSTKELPASELKSKRGATIRVAAPLVIELEENDYASPAVEISKVEISDTGHVSVCVHAGDKTGIESVTLYMNGEALTTKNAAPYAWQLRPKKGYHTLWAVAQDGSQKRNQRKSFKRTIEVIHVDGSR